MLPDQLPFLAAAIMVVAFLYSSVGHAGASGYIAVMSLFSLAPAVIKPTALVLNILVAGIGAWQFWRAGYFSWRLFWPFAVLAIPLAFVGGYINLPTPVFKGLVGVVLIFSAVRFFWRPADDSVQQPPSLPGSLLLGAGMGLLAGLTGTGGGIFLTPLLLMMRWAQAKPAAAVSALFILVNSAAGLLGNLSSTKSFPPFAIVLAIGAVAGGTAGSWLGSRRFEPAVIKRLLALVLLIAGLKLILTA
ncbi:MAG: sulfite exporter TauE/SafE family protein [Verrucomicrobiota bacterium]